MTHRGPFQPRPFCDSVIHRNCRKNERLKWDAKQKNKPAQLPFLEGFIEIPGLSWFQTLKCALLSKAVAFSYLFWNTASVFQCLHIQAYIYVKCLTSKSEVFPPDWVNLAHTLESGSSSVSNVSLLENATLHTWGAADKSTTWIWHWGDPPTSPGLPCKGEVRDIDIRLLFDFWGVTSIWLRLMFSC